MRNECTCVTAFPRRRTIFTAFSCSSFCQFANRMVFNLVDSLLNNFEWHFLGLVGSFCHELQFSCEGTSAIYVGLIKFVKSVATQLNDLVVTVVKVDAGS